MEMGIVADKGLPEELDGMMAASAAPAGEAEASGEPPRFGEAATADIARCSATPSRALRCR